MSYSIDEGVQDTERRLKAMKKVRERFPDARLDGEWFAVGAAKDATDVVQLDGILYAACDVGGLYVLDHTGCMSLTELIYALKQYHPDAYRAVLNVVARRVSSPPSSEYPK